MAATESLSLPSNLDLFTDNYPPSSAENELNEWLEAMEETFEPRDENEVIIERFREYLIVVRSREMVFEGPDPQTDELMVRRVPSAGESRYTQAGRVKMKRKLAKRLSREREPGVMLTLTVDPKRYTKRWAWEQMWPEYAGFRKRLGKYRKRLGQRESLRYVAVLEQHKSGYPHMHIAYPGLGFLAKKEVLNRLWRMGKNHVAGGRRGRTVTISPLGYVTKYIGKMNGWTEEGLAHLWHSGARLYNLSRRFYEVPRPPPAPDWKLLRMRYTNDDVRSTVKRVAAIRCITRMHGKKREEKNEEMILADLSAWFRERRSMEMFRER